LPGRRRASIHVKEKGCSRRLVDILEEVLEGPEGIRERQNPSYERLSARKRSGGVAAMLEDTLVEDAEFRARNATARRAKARKTPGGRCGGVASDNESSSLGGKRRYSLGGGERGGVVRRITLLGRGHIVVEKRSSILKMGRMPPKRSATKKRGACKETNCEEKAGRVHSQGGIFLGTRYLCWGPAHG